MQKNLYIKLNHFAVYLKLTEHHKIPILNFVLKSLKRRKPWIESMAVWKGWSFQETMAAVDRQVASQLPGNSVGTLDLFYLLSGKIFCQSYLVGICGRYSSALGILEVWPTTVCKCSKFAARPYGIKAPQTAWDQGPALPLTINSHVALGSSLPSQCLSPFIFKMSLRPSLIVEWLRFCAPNAEGTGSIPGQGIKIPYAPQFMGSMGSQRVGHNWASFTFTFHAPQFSQK